MKADLTIAKLLALTEDQKVEAFERIANIYMLTPDPNELDQDITRLLESYTEATNKKFYFTFGTDIHFPFYKGWVEVNANSENDAVELFNSHYPERHKGIVNCAFIYSQQEFEQTEMLTKGGWGSCHMVLG